MDWSLRTPPDGWKVIFTTVGGRPTDEDPIDLLQGHERRQAARRLSQAMVATTVRHEAEVSGDALYWAAVVARIVQRGCRPPIPYSVEDAIRGDRDVSLEAAAVRHSLLFDPVDLDPAVELHETYERPFWQQLRDAAPAASGWCWPQAPLEGLIGTDDDTERWVDFLFTVPWSTQAVVLEIDGSGHLQRRLPDRERDALLRRAGYRVERIPGGDDELDGFVGRFVRRAGSYVGEPPERSNDVDRIVHGPTQIHRFLYAVATSVAEGLLTPGRPWRIALDEPTGAVERAMGPLLDLLRGIDDVWQLDVVPSAVTINGTRWVRRGERFEPVPSLSGSEDLRIDIDPFSAPHHRLPEASDASVVVRGALLPVDLGWAGPASTERRNVVPNESGRAALLLVLRELFGHPEFREGQLEAVTRVLSGGDACVLLPTGYGKTLIYQMAGLLRPGISLVVAPLKSLIDDQERRLRELGIDRVAGFHSGRDLGAGEREELHRAVANGDRLFVLVAPERLQIAEFRDALREAATERLVNLAVVDEAHCVSEWGHQFRTSYLRLGRNLRRLCAAFDDVPPPILALTGTASPAVLRDVLIELGMDPDEPGILHRPSSFDRPNLHFRFVRANADDRAAAFEEALRAVMGSFGVDAAPHAAASEPDIPSGIVFVPHRSSRSPLGVEAQAEAVRRILGLPAERVARYAGSRWDTFGKADKALWGVSSWEEFKAKNAEAFRTDRAPVMVSTNAFGMGIDKPNIRWTIHVTHPNSLEAFAQEAGRAGRDGRPAQCLLIAAPGTGPRSDFAIQQYFHLRSFPALAEELAVATAVAAELLESAHPTARVQIPRRRSWGGDDDDEAKARERALYRLMIIGLVDDYTIQYRANTFTVDLSDYSPESMEGAVRAFIDRATAGQRRYDAMLPPLDAPLSDRVEGYLHVVLKVLYDTVVPGRLRALEEMNRIAVEAPGNEDFHQRLDAYLGAGQISLLLDKVSRADRLDVLGALTELEEQTPATRQEWAAASGRYLESYPDHAFILMIRALGEAWLEGGDRDRFRRTLHDAMRSLPDYGVEPEEAVELIGWVLQTLRTYYGGERWEWVSDVWDECIEAGWDDTWLTPLEDQVLDNAAQGWFHPEELDVVLAQRVRRLAAVA